MGMEEVAPGRRPGFAAGRLNIHHHTTIRVTRDASSPRGRSDALMSVVNGLSAGIQLLLKEHSNLYAHGWKRSLKDVGDHALMRGLATALPMMRPGLSLPYCGRRRCRPQSIRREYPCRGCASAYAREDM